MQRLPVLLLLLLCTTAEHCELWYACEPGSAFCIDADLRVYSGAL